MELLVFVSDVGFPIAAACVGMYFVYLIKKGAEAPFSFLSYPAG